MNPLTSLTRRSRALLKDVEERCQITIEERTTPLGKLEGTMLMGTVVLMEKMAHLMDRSLELVESQLRESELSQEVMELQKELLRKQLSDQEGE